MPLLERAKDMIIAWVEREGTVPEIKGRTACKVGRWLAHGEDNTDIAPFDRKEGDTPVTSGRLTSLGTICLKLPYIESISSVVTEIVGCEGPEDEEVW